MKILLIGEYSNVHNTLARGLRELGHTVTVISMVTSGRIIHVTLTSADALES